ncbi:MAG: radical SAM protein [Candidatus Methanoperedens sp.]|nr:radical SAM protein [Candidatus Methanoperedens sp.]
MGKSETKQKVCIKDRNQKLGFKECVEKYPEVPEPIILHIDTTLRGVKFTENVLERAKELNACFGAVEETCPTILLKDGTPIAGGQRSASLNDGNNYTVDIVDDKITILDGNEPLAQGDFVSTPEYYGKKTSNGTPMEKVSESTEDALSFQPYAYCHFWENGNHCKYCSLPKDYRKIHGGLNQLNPQDCYETVKEALKEQGRWQLIHLSSGSDFGGETPYDNEVNRYIEIITAIGKNFKSTFPVRLVSSAFSEDQLNRLAETGADIHYEPHIEVWDEKLFKWICPGKSKWFGRDYWINSAIKAVDVFGENHVCTQVVGGVETAQPYGFKTNDDALKSTFEGAEYFARHGVTISSTIWGVRKGSEFFREQQKRPNLEYYVRLTQGLHDIRKNYGIRLDWNEHHADTRLDRLDY